METKTLVLNNVDRQDLETMHVGNSKAASRSLQRHLRAAGTVGASHGQLAI